jgi:hypothetical protein
LGGGRTAIGGTVVGEPQGLPRDGSWSLFIRWSATTPGAREALLDAMLSNDAGDSYSVIGLDRPDDVHLTLKTQPATTWATLWRPVP